mgnify:CR=1 FL=1
MVGELRTWRNPVDPEVFLAVYHRETRGKVLCEEFVDDREGAVVVGVRLLDMRVERMVVDRRTVCERDQFVAHVDTAASSISSSSKCSKALCMARCSAHSLRGVPFVGPAPFAFERHAFVEAVGRQLFVAVVGVFGREALMWLRLGW